MYCPHCGKQIPDDSRFCHFCGIRINSVRKTTVQSTKNYSQALLYNLNVPKPKRPFYYSDDMHPKYIAQYVRNMGFNHQSNDFIYATSTPNGQAPTIASRWVRKFADTGIELFILSFEDKGLLIMNIIEDLTGAPTSSKVFYYFTQKNRFIAKSKIQSIKLKPDQLSKVLLVQTGNFQIGFHIPPVWHYRVFQTENYRNLDKIVRKFK